MPHTNTNNVLEAFEEQVIIIDNIINNMARGTYQTYEDFEKDLNLIGGMSGFIPQLIKLLAFFPALQQVGQITTAPFLTRLKQLSDDKFNLTRLSNSEIVNLFHRGYIDLNEGRRLLVKLGYDDTDAFRLLRLANATINENDVINLGRRGKISPTTVREKLREMGYAEGDVIDLFSARQPYPPVQDLIRFAVKEVYTPSIAEQFGLYAEFPQEFGREADKLGLDQKYAQQYWAAHWDLPSPTMGYEMFHRGIISKDQLFSLLKALDVMPFWREKLMQLSHRIIGRVDVRRLYAYGIYNKDQVYANYIKEGYSPEDAKSLTDFTVAYDAETDEKHKTKLKSLTYSVILKAYRRGIIDRNEAKNEIVKLGYKEDEIELLLALTDYDIYVDTHKDKKEEHDTKLANLATSAYVRKAISYSDLIEYLKSAGYSDKDAEKEALISKAEYEIKFKSQLAQLVQQQYMEGLFTNNDVINSLTSLEFTASEAAQILDQMTLLKQFGTKKPTISQFTSLFKSGFIPQDEYVQILLDEGYAEKYIPYLLELAGVQEGT